MDSTRRKMGQQWSSRSQTPTRTPSFSFMDLGPEDLAYKSTIHVSSPLARSSRIFSVKRRRYLSNDTGLHSGSVFFPGHNKSHPFVELANLQSKSLDSYPEANIYAPEPAFIPLGDKRNTFPVYDALGIRQSNLTGSSGTEVWGRGSVVQTSDLQSPPFIISQKEEQGSSGLFNSSNFPAAIDEATRFSASTVGSQLPEETVQDVSATNIPLSPPPYKDSQSNIIPFRERVTPLKPRKRHEHVQPPPSTQQSRAILRTCAKHGPSPLRSMFIPAEEQSTDIIGFSLGDSLNEQPPNILSTNHEVSELASCILEKKPLSEAKSSEDSLTNLLKELLDETSAWDESLFVDENFKALVGGEGTSKDQIRRNNDSLTEPSDKSRQGGGQDHDLEEILEVEDVDFDIGNFRLYDQDNSFWDEEVFQDPRYFRLLTRFIL
ncbi:hypothetical protein CPC08DRAFT_758271 [Agrocybe pediades]|nr:hypothetical protein CPC08DRAFT_758271 [Agrocybe pediades]